MTSRLSRAWRITLRAICLSCALALAPSAGHPQSAECLDAYEVLVKVKEQLFAGNLSKEQLVALHHRIKARTRDCGDLAELWQLRGRLAHLIDDAADVDVVKARGSALFSTEAPVRRGAFDPAAPVGKRWALLAGTSTFQHKDTLGVTDLEYAQADVTLIKDALSSRWGFSDVTTLAGARFTLDAWRAAVARLREQVAENDLVLIYLVSHGRSTREDRNSTSFILTHDSRGGDAALVYTTSIQVIDLVQELARELRSQRVVILLDACFSGDAISGQKDYAGHPAPYLLDAFTRGSGRVVVAASRADQRSWELPSRKQGAFAYCFAHAATGAATLGEIFTSMQGCVTNEVRALGPSYQQEPQMFASDGARAIVLGASTR